MAETWEQLAMRRATMAVRNLLAQSKNPRTTLGRMAPTSVAFHVAWAAIDEYRKARERQVQAACEPYANGKGWWHTPGCPHIDWGDEAPHGG